MTINIHAFLFIIILILLIILILSIIKSEIDKNKVTSKQENVDFDKYEKEYMSQEDIKKIDSNINLDTFLDYIFDIYVELEDAWTDFNYDKLKKLVSFDIYEEYEKKLNKFQLNDVRNVVNNFKYISAGITNIKKTNSKEEITLLMHVQLRDYKIDSVSGKMIDGDRRKKYDNLYEIILTRKNNKETIYCPYCGIELTDENLDICPNCKASTNDNKFDFIITKIEIIRQMQN